VNTDSTSVRVGTILQKAVQQGKLLLVQDLLEQGVDPTATCKEIRESPMEISKKSSTEMRRLLSKFTEMPEHIKLHHLSELMAIKEDKDKDKDNVQEEFKEILGTLPVKLVNYESVVDMGYMGQGTLLQSAVKEDQEDFVQILMDFGADQRWTNDRNQKTPMEIALEGTWHFKVLMQIASFVNQDTPSSDKLKILRMFMDKFSYGAEDGYEEQFKRCLDGIPVSEVLSLEQVIHWHLPGDYNQETKVSINWVQFAAAQGKTGYLQLLLNHGLDADAHKEGTPRALELAAVTGKIDTFSMLADHLQLNRKIDQRFQLGKLLLLGMVGREEEFKELLPTVPSEKVSAEPVCGSTLLQDFARCGKTCAVAALLQYGVDPDAITEENRNNPAYLAWKKENLEVLVELNKVTELYPNIMESPLGRQVLRREEKEWRKKMEEKQEELMNEVISLQKGDPAKKTSESNNSSPFNVPAIVSAAFVFGFFACYLFSTNFH